MSPPRIDIRLGLPGAAGASVVRCRIEEGLSELTRARVELSAADDLDLGPAVGGGASLALLLDGLEVRRWTLVLGGARLAEASGDGALRYELELNDPLWPLGLGLDTRRFRDRSVQAIVSTVLGEAGIPFAWQLTRPLPERSYVVQYRESSLAFVRRLLEREGIFHRADPDGVVILADTSAAAPPVEPVASFELLEAAGALDHATTGIHALRKVARVATGAVTVNDYTWKNPRLDLLRSSAAARDAELEVYDYPGGYRDPAEGARIARTRLEAARATTSTVEGSGDVPGFAPGLAFTFGSNAGAAFAGELVLVHVEHTARSAAHVHGEGAEAAVYENTFRALPKGTPFRPPWTTPEPRVAGSHTAMVRGPAGEEIHTDRHGRFKAEPHWDREASGTDEGARWVRMLQETASSMTLARVGWEVGVGHVEGDPSRPIGLFRHLDGEAPPVYPQPEHEGVMTIRSPSSPATGGYHELLLDDRAGRMRFDLRAERDLASVALHDRIEAIGNDDLRLAGGRLARAVGGDQAVSVGAGSSSGWGADHVLAVQKDREKVVRGSETVAVGGSSATVTRGDQTEEVGSLRLTVAGGLGPPGAREIGGAVTGLATGTGMSAARQAGSSLALGKGVAAAGASAGGAVQGALPALGGMAAGLLTHGAITRTAGRSLRRTVGGAFLSVAVADVTTKVGYGYAETVGGAKVTLAQGSIAQKVDGPMAFTVGSAVIRAARTITSTADAIRVNVGALATFTSRDGLTVKAGKLGKPITIEAHTSMQIKLGEEGKDGAAGKEVTIDLSPEGIAFTGGDLHLEAVGKVIVKGGHLNFVAAPGGAK